MRRVSTNTGNIPAAVRELVQASQDNDVTDIAQNFSFIGSLTPTYVLNLSSPTAANIAAVLGTLLLAMQKGGINRTT